MRGSHETKKTPLTLKSHGAFSLNSPPPKSAQLQAYFVVCIEGMARKCSSKNNVSSSIYGVSDARFKSRHARSFLKPRLQINRALCESFFGHVFRSEEHTSELQSLRHLVCRLL